ncbi:MAG: AbrB/MazE/SpoVT family DNA-binding domain-containing protein [Sphingomonas sp.]|jgi:antitoxin VapB
MAKEYRAKVFKSGNSVALRLPKALGITEGTEMYLRELGGRYSFEPVDAERRKIDLTGIAGIAPGLQPLTPEQRSFEPSPRPWDDAEWLGPDKA